MLAAYLRGLLKPALRYGFSSLAFEGLKLEMMLAQVKIEDFSQSVQSDSSVIPTLTDESKQQTLRRIHVQLERRSQLQLMDIYGLAHGKRGSEHETSQGKISMVQLFRLVEREGIFGAVDKHFTPEEE
jgi:hypothetical protein